MLNYIYIELYIIIINPISIQHHNTFTMCVVRCETFI